MPFQPSNPPHESGIIRGLSKAPLHFQNLVAELIDNAISARGQGFKILVNLSRVPEGGDLFQLTVSDDSGGIPEPKLRTKVFSIGSPPEGNSYLNEHGFGLKNVIAKAEALTERPWCFYTRDATALSKGTFFFAQRPYSFSQAIEEKPAADWPSWGTPGPGTIVQLFLPLTFLQSVALGRRGAAPRTPEKVIDYLREHLGVFYRGYLEGGARALGRIETSLDWGTPDPVDAVHPDYQTKKQVSFPVTVGNHRIHIEGVIGLVEKNSAETKERLYYYRHAPESQGVDIRIGNRVVATRLIEEIWERDRHPSLNGVAGEFRIPVEPNALPSTLNNKTSLDFDDPNWITIASAINQVVPKDDIPHGGGKSEDDLRDELYTQIEGLRNPAHEVAKERDCGHGVYIDVFWDQSRTGGPVEIYEVKKGKAQPLDVYQLVMYWDSLVSTGVQPTQGHLVSDGLTSGVPAFISLINGRKDANGIPYNLKSEDWMSHGIEP